MSVLDKDELSLAMIAVEFGIDRHLLMENLSKTKGFPQFTRIVTIGEGTDRGKKRVYNRQEIAEFLDNYKAKNTQKTNQMLDFLAGKYDRKEKQKQYQEAKKLSENRPYRPKIVRLKSDWM